MQSMGHEDRSSGMPFAGPCPLGVVWKSRVLGFWKQMRTTKGKVKALEYQRGLKTNFRNFLAVGSIKEGPIESSGTSINDIVRKAFIRVKERDKMLSYPLLP